MRAVFSITGCFIEILHLGAAVKTGIDVYNRLTPLAEAERGYSGAAGGELLAAVAAALVVYIVLDKLISSVLTAVLEKMK